MFKPTMSVDIKDNNGKKVRSISREKSSEEKQQDLVTKVAELEARIEALENKK